MKPKLASVLAIVLTVALILSGCTQPPAGTPQPTQAAAQPTAAPQQPAAKAKYVIATDAAFPPMEFVDENKNIVGFDIDLMNAIAKV
ncbi:MAG: transporter substrate-binding domain-containing protein, partial [Chloroflexi bacterium]|nr:transporter substrate-binding domain-containing protein [Chloroflexota bacterium]